MPKNKLKGLNTTCNDKVVENTTIKAKKRKKSINAASLGSKSVDQAITKSDQTGSEKTNANKISDAVSTHGRISVKSSKSTKIIFEDSDTEVASGSINTQQINSKQKKKKFNDDEADVKDEDIDKFCDEISEEDNEQYESWIKLLETRLSNNKKSI